MSLLGWIGVAGGVWFAAALATALPIARYLRRREQDGDT